MPTHPIWTGAKGRLLNHQDREAQDILFSDILHRFDCGEKIVPAEGHTGVGKSLVVAAMAASLPKPVKFFDSESHPRVVISAFTKSQQATIYRETFPRVERLLPKGYAILMGRANYLCMDRAEIARIEVEVKGDGSRTHYPRMSDAEWALVCSNGDDGCDRKCINDTYLDAKARAKEADALMVNHSLLALNHEIDGLIFGGLGYTTLVADEAHLLPSALRSAYGVELSPTRFGQVGSALAKVGWDRTPVDRAKDVLTNALSQYRKDGMTWASQTAAGVASALMRNEYEFVVTTVENLGDSATRQQKSAARRFDNLMKALRILSDTSGDYASWVTLTGRAKIESQPFDIYEEALALFNSADRTVAMSATMEPLATKSLGLTMRVSTSPQPFDLATRRLGYVSTRGDAGTGAHQWDEEELVALVRTAKVGALVIASSNREKDRAAAALMFAGYRVGVQDGTAGVPDLLEDLKSGRVDVLVGVDSMGTGIDVPGDALRLVVILSALNPNAFANPYLRQTADRFPTSGQAWRDLFTPMKIEKTWQSIGRLIRTPSDYGIVAFLDPRPREITAFRSLLAMDGTGITTSLDDVEAHLGRFA